jgi:hypothetical protein
MTTINQLKEWLNDFPECFRNNAVKVVANKYKMGTDCILDLQVICNDPGGKYEPVISTIEIELES